MNTRRERWFRAGQPEVTAVPSKGLAGAAYSFGVVV
jgi:hypothetical protein